MRADSRTERAPKAWPRTQGWLVGQGTNKRQGVSGARPNQYLCHELMTITNTSRKPPCREMLNLSEYLKANVYEISDLRFQS